MRQQAVEQPRKNILFVTGTRADFGKLKSLMRAVNQDPAFKCSIFATGMHLLKKYGYTLQEIHKENFSRVFPFFNQSTATSKLMDIVLAETIKGLSFYVSENPTDLLVVHGDRIEALAGAIVGALQGIRTAHIEGGERSGTIDELIRHAVTKLSHIHFAATAANKRRLMQLGEFENNIFVIGSPDIDIMLNDDFPPLETVCADYEIPFREYSLFMYHPVVTELDTLKTHIHEVVEALKDSGRNFIVIYPNNDAGSDIILEKIQELQNNKRFRIFPSIRFEKFLVLVRHAQCVVGNSSCGIHEAPVYGVPTVNIGSRQKNRFDYKSIFNVRENREAIVSLLASLPDRCEPVYTYGRGNSAELFLNILHGKAMWEAPLQKSFFDLI